jgi:hypothetical protein
VVQQKLLAAGVTNSMPAWQIVDSARLLPPIPTSQATFGDSTQQALRKLMKSFYDYGRLHWTWAQNAGSAAANGGLVKGLINAVACGSFNQNFKWLAENALGVTGITNGQYTGAFLTMPGGVCIDSKWVGNVCTNTKTYSTLRCFKFTGLYWVVHGGVNYDVCYNNTFGTTTEIVWTNLLPPDPALRNKGGLSLNQMFKLEKPLPEGDYLVTLQQQGPNGWPSWQIVPKTQIMALR